MAEFAKLQATAAKPVELDNTLAEYYELGIDGHGEFRLNYSCVCDSCGYEFKTSHRQDAKVY